MGDANTRPFLEPEEIGQRTPECQHLESAKNTFLYSVYRFALDPTDEAKKESVLKSAKVIEEQRKSFKGFKTQVGRMLPMLVRNDQLAWIKLLAWAGNSHHMFLMLKDISPFRGRSIHTLRCGKISDSLPNVDVLFRQRGAHYDRSAWTIIVSPVKEPVSILMF